MTIRPIRARLARRALRIRTIGRAVLILDGVVAAGTFFGFAYG